MMLRRILLLVVLTAGTATIALGATQATFVLRNGEKVSGELTYRGGAAYTLDGRDYSANEVAIIEFVPGDPPMAELRQIPQTDNNPNELERHVLVGRDGNVIVGKLYKFSPGGETI